MSDEEYYKLYNDLLTDEEQDKLYPLTAQEKKQWQTWVPKGYKITNMQIYEAIKKGIPMPVGDQYRDQEYMMFLKEIVLTPIKDKETIGPRPWPYPEPIPKPIPKPIPRIISEPYIYGGKFPKTDDENSIASNHPTVPVKPENDIKEPSNDEEQPDDIKPPIIPDDEIIKKINEEVNRNTADYVAKITKRRRSLAIPLLLTSLLSLISSVVQVRLPKELTEEQVTSITTSTMDYCINNNDTINDIYNDFYSNVRMGDIYHIGNGNKFTLTSKDAKRFDETHGVFSKTMGEEFDKEDKFEGKYPITGFAIVRKSNNELLAYIEDFYTPTNNTRLDTFVNDALQNTGLSYDDIEVEFHFGRTDKTNNERTRLGWITENNIVLDENKIQQSILKNATYSGSVNNFSGNHITISTPSGDVNIPVKDSNGNYYKKGDKVTGSDGKEYEFSFLEEQTETQYNTTYETKKVPGSLSFNIKDCNLLNALPFILAAVLDALYKSKKNKEYANNPYFKVIDENKVEEFIRQFNNGKGSILNYHQGSVYKKHQIENCILKSYNEQSGEQISSINDLIYEIVDGKILVWKKEPFDKPYNITDTFAKYIAEGVDIGKGFSEEAEEYFNRKGL